MQICADLASHYKFSKKLPETPLLASRLREWGNPHEDITLKVRRYLKKVIVHDAPPQENIADLASVTSTKDIFAQLQELLTQTDLRVVLLIDRLDEGYTPDEVGIALVDGFVQAVIELNSHKPSSLDAYVFVRDNVFRAIAEKSVDFTRNIEGQVLRLSWNERNLFNVVCNRFRIAFADKTEKNLRV